MAYNHTYSYQFTPSSCFVELFLKAYDYKRLPPPKKRENFS